MKRSKPLKRSKPHNDPDDPPSTSAASQPATVDDEVILLDTDEPKLACKKQMSLLNFKGFSRSKTTNKQRAKEDDKKIWGFRSVTCRICGDYFKHQGALTIHMKWRHDGAKIEQDHHETGENCVTMYHRNVPLSQPRVRAITAMSENCVFDIY